MAIITFWGCDKRQTGQTSSIVAVATKMAIERNLRILLVSTSLDDKSIEKCFWKESNQRKKLMTKSDSSGLSAVENGIEGLFRLIASNKIEPSIISDYSRAVLKDRYEVLLGYKAVPEKTYEQNLKDYRESGKQYPKLLQIANQYYDMIFVDLDRNLTEETKKEIKEMSDINFFVTTQKMDYIDQYLSMKTETKGINSLKNTVLIGRYDNFSKYNRKSLGRYLDERKEISVVPYNTLFFEAVEEATIIDLFFKFANIKDTSDKNYYFMTEIKKIDEFIINRLQELQMRMR